MEMASCLDATFLPVLLPLVGAGVNHPVLLIGHPEVLTLQLHVDDEVLWPCQHTSPVAVEPCLFQLFLVKHRCKKMKN